jgi:hypothetical protein
VLSERVAVWCVLCKHDVMLHFEQDDGVWCAVCDTIEGQP